ncbi:malto-oligosyltrehalose trehalohydrolase [Dyadobacter aurulentus]|uniref:malto-oligosyltrehalose trehalohydrolase n=1 Tax=Dyadobacter sp. UC 10 TaxID=2605428 RepID=UPI0011F1B944|nr:malto-oligosyltrehalose trehalohydrolase [Dyadobacter sp. UC 10]KAA0993649.1 malto-oligosyltrehalose trehalohydrolase [Dyadobacter sp. UC 10]
MNNDYIVPGRPGISFNEFGEAEILVWAPLAEEVRISVVSSGEKIPLEKLGYGYWGIKTSGVKPGDSYLFDLGDDQLLPDPASLFQSEGVHGPSEAVDLRDFQWTDQQWVNPALPAYIIYEVHIGTFTPEGTLAAMEKRLDYLADLGVTAIELMPVSQFAGPRNWGYDGVFPYSVQDSYGGPKAMQHFVNACHSKGIAVILDMVYNHLGPEGNVFGQYGHYFTDKYNTPWGEAINFDDAWSDAVRHYFIQNALMWFRDFHIDALRLDAVHAIKDFSPVHVLQEMKMRVDELSEATGRQPYLMVEMDLNDTRYIKPVDQCGFGMDAQWIDEFHHALRVSSGQQQSGYYSDFEPVVSLAKSFRDAYVFDGTYSEHRKRKFGVKADGFPGHRFIVFSQNHDHIGNRMLGERTSQLVSYEMQKLLAGTVMVSPFLPLLFMGEEWSESNPFQYFVSHTDPELAEAVRKGRKREFAAFHLEGDAPDPVGEETFQQSKLQWDLLEKEPHRTMFRYYKQLISLRKEQPALSAADRSGLTVTVPEGKELIILERNTAGQLLVAVLNFAKNSEEVVLPHAQKWQKLIASSDQEWNGDRTLPEHLEAGALHVAAESFTLYAAS